MKTLLLSLTPRIPTFLACLVLCSACNANEVRIEGLRHTAPELKALGKEAIIEIAEKEIQEEFEEFSKENFDRIKVLVNEDSVYVTFGMSARYVPKNSVAFYGLLWGLAVPARGIGASFDNVANPRNATDLGEPRFFQPDATSEEAIAFVLKVLEADGETLYGSDEMTIREEDSVYKVNIENQYAGAGYTISRETGEILDGWHADNFPMPGGDEGGLGLKEFVEPDAKLD